MTSGDKPTLLDHEAWLAHYTRADTAFGFILPDRRLLMNPYSRMNDPFEREGLSFSAGGGYGDAWTERFEYANVVLRKVRATARIASLSVAAATQAERHSAAYSLAAPWARPRMWDQYGGAHAGACLVFDRHRLTQIAAQEGYECGAVAYSDGGFADCEAARAPQDLAAMTNSEIEMAVHDHAQQNTRDVWYLKTRDWQGEHEYRFLFDPTLHRAEPFEADEPCYLPIGDSLRYVVLGQNFPSWRLSTVRERLSTYPGVQARRLAWSGGRAYLDPVFP